MATSKINKECSTDLAGQPAVEREALEVRVIQGYRSGELTHYQASRLLGMSRFGFESFLKDRKIYDHAYGPADFEEDLRILKGLEPKGTGR